MVGCKAYARLSDRYDAFKMSAGFDDDFRSGEIAGDGGTLLDLDPVVSAKPPLYGAIDDEFARDGFGVHIRQFTHRDAMTRHAYGTFDFTVDVQVLFRRNRSSDFYACAYVGR